MNGRRKRVSRQPIGAGFVDRWGEKWASWMPWNVQDGEKSPNWPLDLGIAALVFASVALAHQRLDAGAANLIEDARLYYVIAPSIGLAAMIASRFVGDSIIRRSVQFALVGSLFTHLLLTVMAVNYDVFSPYLVTATTGIKPERSPIRKTLPDYLFDNPSQPNVAVDWNRPVQTQTASPVKPLQTRKLPPVDRTAAVLELPSPVIDRLPNESAHLRRRDIDSSSQPQLADAPSMLAKRSGESETMAQPAMSPQIDVPTSDRSPAESPPAQSPPAQSPVDLAASPRRDRSSPRFQNPALTSPRQMTQNAAARSLALDRSAAMTPPAITTAPDVSAANAVAAPRQRRQRPSQSIPAGQSPPITSVAVASRSPAASRVIQPLALTISPKNRPPRRPLGGVRSPRQIAGGPPDAVSTDAASFDAPPRMAEMADPWSQPPIVSASDIGRPGNFRNSDLVSRDLVRRDSAAVSMMPDQSLLQRVEVPAAPAVDPSRADQSSQTNSPSVSMMAPSRSASTERERDRRPKNNPLSDVIASVSPSMSIDILAPEGSFGLGIVPADRGGVAPDPDAQQMSASIDLSPLKRERRRVGGPMNAVGSKVAAVEMFARRIQRTQGGAALSPVGEVGPDTEEAIERGLAYLADTQNEDGSWSLQGHGDRVVLQSDTAATGLALLSFQGAGYTHRKHQYAQTVAKGIDWLKRNQRSNGDLYRRENDLSDRNVALYSHGIAALAMSEAFGMTQDESIRSVAQSALDYIVATQHKKLGGWRYTPQVTADTSVSGWMMMALKSGELGGLEVPQRTYRGISDWLDAAQVDVDRADRYRYNPYAPDTPRQGHGRLPTPTMTAVGMLMRMYGGWRRDNPAMQSAAKYLLKYPPTMGDPENSQRDAYYWYYATQVMFHMGGETWQQWNRYLNPVLIESQLVDGPFSGSWDPKIPVEDRWSIHGGRIYVTTMNLLNLEVYYRHLPIYEDTAR